MTDSFQGGSFDPIESENYVPALQESYKQINAGMARYYEQLRENDANMVKSAGKGMEALASMSGTLASVMQMKAKEKQEADYALGYQYAFDYGTPQEDVDSFNEAETNAKEQQGIIFDTSFEWEANGGDIFTSQKFRNMSPAAKLGVAVGWAQNKVSAYNPLLNDEVKNAVSYEEYQAALEKHRMNFFKEFGQMNPAILNKYVFPEQREKEQAAYNTWYTKRETEIKAQRKEFALSEFNNCVKTQGGNCIVDFIGKVKNDEGGPGAARTSAIQHLNTLAKNGELPDDYIDSIEGETFVAYDGSEQTIGGYYSSDIKQIRDSAQAYKAEELRRSNAQKVVDNAQELDDLTSSDEFKKLQVGVGLNNEQLTMLEDLKNKQLGSRLTYDSRIDTLITNLNKNKIAIDSDRSELRGLLGKGLLTEEKLAEYHPTLQKEFLPDVQNLNKARAYEKSDHEYLMGMVKKEAGITPLGTGDPKVDKLGEYFQKQYTQRVADILSKTDNITPADAANQARIELETDFNNNRSKYQTTKGDWIIPGTPTAEEVLKQRMSINADSAEVRQYVQKMGISSLDSPNLYFSQKELLDVAKSALRGTPDIPSKARKIAKLLSQYDPDITALDVINRQMTAIDPNFQGLEDPESIKAFKELPRGSKVLFNHDGTSNVSARVWGTSGKNNVSIVPDGQGATLEELSKTVGVDFGVLAASYEIGNMFDIDMTVENPLSQLSDFEMLELNKSIYKYSGGTNKDALRNTIRKGFLTRSKIME